MLRENDTRRVEKQETVWKYMHECGALLIRRMYHLLSKTGTAHPVEYTLVPVLQLEVSVAKPWWNLVGVVPRVI